MRMARIQTWCVAAIEQNIQAGEQAAQEHRMARTAKPAGIHPYSCIAGMLALACVGAYLSQSVTSPIWFAVATLGWFGYKAV
jgi:hypothetical protein